MPHRVTLRVPGMFRPSQGDHLGIVGVPDLCSMAALVERRMTRSTTRQSRHKHDLCDSYATAALAAGVPVKVVSPQVGHGPRRRHIEGLRRTSCPDDEDAALRADSLLAP